MYVAGDDGLGSHSALMSPCSLIPGVVRQEDSDSVFMKSVHSGPEPLQAPRQILHHVKLIPDLSLVNYSVSTCLWLVTCHLCRCWGNSARAGHCPRPRISWWHPPQTCPLSRHQSLCRRGTWSNIVRGLDNKGLICLSWIITWGCMKEVLAQLTSGKS